MFSVMSRPNKRSIILSKEQHTLVWIVCGDIIAHGITVAKNGFHTFKVNQYEIIKNRKDIIYLDTGKGTFLVNESHYFCPYHAKKT